MKGLRFYTGIRTKQIVKKNGFYYVIDISNPKLKCNESNSKTN
jgi:hypothetical protein